MESSPAVHIPVRSISLPSRLRSNFHNIESELTKLKSWESTVPSGSETIQLGLVRVAELYNCLQELIHSPLTQKALHHHHQYSNLVEEALDGSVELLDVCGNARELFLMMKEYVNDLQSALRRKGGSSSIKGNIRAYICFRKKVIKKDISKCLKALKRMETNNIESFPVMDSSDHVSFLVKVVREVRAITRSMLRSLMLFLSVPVMKTKASGWSLVSKLLLSSERSQKTLNELGAVDAAVYTIHGEMRRNNDAKVDVQEVQERLERLDGRIKGFEGELDCLFTCLIRNRASLLNLVTP